jgi:16S rRNA (uracil1498-N3)-methyltransferase
LVLPGSPRKVSVQRRFSVDPDFFNFQFSIFNFEFHMRHRIFVELIEPRTVVAGEEFHHSIRVVRARVGEEVELFDSRGNAARGTIESIERDRATVVAGETLPSRESPLALHLAMAIIQLDKFDLVIQKATELGVRSIIPMITARVDLRPERYSGKAERWERIAFEAVKQSGRTAVPTIAQPLPFAAVVQRTGIRVLFDADAPADPLPEAQEATLLVGPEGGWTEEELDEARAAGCLFQRLGPRRLRAETAAIAGTAILASRLGDL